MDGNTIELDQQANSERACQLCEQPTTEIAVHDECFRLASRLYVHGIDSLNSSPRHGYDSEVIRRLAPVCYLCGEAESEHLEHVHPQARGGSNHWSNLGGACEACNMSKGARIGITDEQQQRLDVQHQAFKEAAGRLTDDILMQDAMPIIEEMIEQRADPNDFTWSNDVPDDIREELETILEWAPERDVVVERALALVLASPDNNIWDDEDSI
jgi:hypothetical protein